MSVCTSCSLCMYRQRSMNVFSPAPIALGSLVAQRLTLFALGILLKVLAELCAVFTCLTSY